MEGWAKLGSLLDKKHEAPVAKAAGSMLDRIASMAARLERRLTDAFNNGQAARRFNGVDVMMVPAAHLEEVGEAVQARQTVSHGRFEHVSAMRFVDLEEVSHADAW